MNKFFIAGTDTGVGKTVASAVLTLAMRAYYWKPIQTGLAEDEVEHDIVQGLTGLDKTHFFPSTYAFQAGLAIDQAANLENTAVDLDQCQLPEVPHPLIVEGAGGVFHPINATKTLFDLMRKLSLPVIIVSRGTVGTINHTLLTIDALRHRNIEIQGVIYSGDLIKESQFTIERLGNVRTLFHIPRFSSLTKSTLTQWVFENQSAILEGLK